MGWIADFVRTYQTIVAGALALCGVASGLIWNSHIARRERAAKTVHDRETLKVALVEQLRALKTSMDFRDQALGQEKASTYALSDDPLTYVFRPLIDKLGLLPPDVLAKVLPAYLEAEHLPKSLRLLQVEDAPAIMAHFIVIPRSNYERARYQHRTRAEDIGAAIVALERWQPGG